MYGEDGVPEYEVDAETIDALYEIASVSQQNTSHALLVLEDTNTQIESHKRRSTFVTRHTIEKTGKHTDVLRSNYPFLRKALTCRLSSPHLDC